MKFSRCKASPPCACAAALLVLVLGGCGDRDDGRTVGQRIDALLNRSAQAGREVKEGAQQAAGDTRSAVMGAASGAKSGASSLGQKIDDAQITAKVKTGLSADKDIAAGQVDVETAAGVVTLSGSVASDAARQRATQIARNVLDVKDVRNQLTVQLPR